MKKTFNLLILCAFMVFPLSNATAQLWSTETIFSPSTSTLIGNASRIGFHYNNWTTYYMRYNDTSYLCSILNDVLGISTPASVKIPMEQDFVITDFQKFRFYQGFIGSYQGVGMYGRIFDYDLTISDNAYYFFEMPAVDCINRIALIKAPSNSPYQTKAFAIGKKSGAYYLPQSVILEFYAEGAGTFWPYNYFPMSYNPATGEQEIADDVITLDNHVIFATRDNRNLHPPVNLRISDTNLTTSDINVQWQFLLPPYETVYGEIRLQPLPNRQFVLTYVKYDFMEDGYFLHIDKIILPDLLIGNTTIISHDIPINKSCSEMVDVTYEPDVNVMMILLNGDNRSEIYHIDPFSNTTSLAYKLDYPHGNFWSIDTIGSYYMYNVDRYVAIGNDRIISQDISNGIEIENSCHAIIRIPSLLKNSPTVRRARDPIDHYSDNKIYFLREKPGRLFDGVQNCIINNVEDKSIR